MASKEKKERPKIRKESDKIQNIRKRQLSTICRHLSSQPKIVFVDLHPPLTKFEYRLLVQKAKSTRPGIRLRVIRSIRKLFHADTVLKDNLIDHGIISALVDCLIELENPKLQYEASLAITNACTKDCSYAHLVVQNGGIPLLMLVLNSTSCPKVQAQIITAFGNIISCSPYLRDSVIDFHFLSRLISFVKPSTTITLLRKIAVVVAYLCETTNPPVAGYVLIDLLPVLNELIKIKDFSILTDTVYAISNIIDAIDGYDDISHKIENSDILTNLIELCSNTQSNMARDAINVIQKLVYRSDKFVQGFIDAGGLIHIPGLLCSSSLEIRKASVLIISMVTSVSYVLIQEVINAGLIPKVFKYLKFTQRHYSKLRFDTLWLMYNLSLNANNQQLYYIIHVGALQHVCDILYFLWDRKKYVILALRTLHNMLANLDSHKDTFIRFFEKSNGPKILLPLLEDEDEEIQSSALEVFYMCGLHVEESEYIFLD